MWGTPSAGSSSFRCMGCLQLSRAYLSVPAFPPSLSPSSVCGRRVASLPQVPFCRSLSVAPPSTSVHTTDYNWERSSALGGVMTLALRGLANSPHCGITQCRLFSSGMRNTKAGIKNPYWRHKGFWEWRRREITALNRRMRARKHIFPRPVAYLPPGHPVSLSHSQTLTEARTQTHTPSEILFDAPGPNTESSRSDRGSRPRAPLKRHGGFLYDGDRNGVYVEDLSYLAAPVKGEGRVWVAKRRDIPLGRKRLLLLLRLVKGLQLTDAIDWLQALALHRCNSLLNVLLKQQQQIRDEGADASRVYIQSYIIGPAGHVKTMQVGYHYRVSFLKSYRYSVALRLRELPLHELFHRSFILKQPPRSLTHDMRLALRQKQLPLEVVRDWIPYLDAATRYSHKRRLKQLDRQHLFNYFLARRAFVVSYISRMRQMSHEEAAARGTSLEAVQQGLGGKQIKGLYVPDN